MIRLGKVNELINIIRDNPEIAKYLTVEMLFTPDMIAIFSEITARHFRDRKDTLEFMQAKWANSERLSERVLSGQFRAEYYKHIKINERGKTRDITPPTFETKIVQKIICTFILRVPLEIDMIDGSYATIEGRGTELMYEHIVEMLNKAVKDGRKKIVLTDFANYFGSIQIKLLRENVFERFVYQKSLIDLIMCFFVDERGLVLGNEISQLPASYYVTPFDKHVTEEMQIPYKRFMDDTIAICKNQAEAKAYIQEFIRYTEMLGLSYKAEKLKVLGLGADFVFCKERFFYNRETKEYYRLLNTKRVRTERRKIRKIETEEDLNTQYFGVRGVFYSHPNAKKVLADLDHAYETRIEQMEDQRKEKEQEIRQGEYEEIIKLHIDTHPESPWTSMPYEYELTRKDGAVQKRGTSEIHHNYPEQAYLHALCNVVKQTTKKQRILVISNVDFEPIISRSIIHQKNMTFLENIREYADTGKISFVREEKQREGE